MTTTSRFDACFCRFSWWKSGGTVIPPRDFRFGITELPVFTGVLKDFDMRAPAPACAHAPAHGRNALPSFTAGRSRGFQPATLTTTHPLNLKRSTMKRRTGEIFIDHDGNWMIVEEVDGDCLEKCKLCAYYQKDCWRYLNESGDCQYTFRDERRLIFRHYIDSNSLK